MLAEKKKEHWGRASALAREGSRERRNAAERHGKKGKKKKERGIAPFFETRGRRTPTPNKGNRGGGALLLTPKRE